MDKEEKAIVFFDESCGFCITMINFLIKIDKKKILYFAPLQGITASERLLDCIPDYKKLNTVIFYLGKRKLFLYAKAVFRIFFELGGVYMLIGWLYFLPPWFIDPLYRWMTKRRACFSFHKKLKSSVRMLP